MKTNTQQNNPVAIRALFDLGAIVMTRGVYHSDLSAAFINDILTRHLFGDWGHVDPEDAKTNFEAVQIGNRILSAYALDDSKPCKGYGENCIWVITEHDRSVTTILLPSEY